VLPPELCATPDELAIGLRFVQSLSPAGVGARSPSECLRLQLERQPDARAGQALAVAIVRDHLDLLAAHDTAHLMRALGCDEAALRAANAAILRLDPHPRHAFGSHQARFVIADVIVRRRAGGWTATINPQTLPRVRLNALYADALRRDRAGGNGQLAD
jgi:RNA polymerase sigma-54 factor